MPSTFTTSCRFELQETGENLNVWGIALNTRAIALIDQAMDGYQSIDLASGATFDLSSATYTKNGESDTSRRRVLRFTNSNAAGTAITIPSVTKNYWIINAGSYPITFAPSGSLTPASVPAGTSAFIWTDGADCFAFRSRLNELAAPNGSVAMGSQKITGLADGTADGDAVNKLQVTTLTAASVQLANDWAQKISDFVTGSDNSAKSWAIGGTGNGDPAAGSAKEWATSTSTVDGGLKGARGYANDASASATSASGFSTAASGYATTALGHSNTASGFATAASGSATSAANTLLDFQDKYVNNAMAGTFPASGNFSGRVAWSGSALGVYDGANYVAITGTPPASESVQGIAELANQTETDTGTDDLRIVTPLKNAANLDKRLTVQTFSSSASWTKPTLAKYVLVEAWGGAGGGGSGAKQNQAVNRGGGSGGAGGNYTSSVFPASALASSESVVIGAGGAGGGSQTTVSTNGINGTAGGGTTFGAWLLAAGGAAGNGGSSTAAAAAAGTAMPAPATSEGGGISGSTSSSTDSITPANTRRSGAGGGGGGSANNTNVARAPAAGSAPVGIGIAALGTGSGGAAGTTGAAPTTGTSGPAFGAGGGGGGGGVNAANNVAGANGGNGGVAGGGGGGGIGTGTGNSGAGGTGGNGFVRITTW